MEHSYENADALVRTARSATGEPLSEFVSSLIKQQYSVSYVCQLAQHALAFERWCEDRRIPFHTLKDDDIARYQRFRSRHRSRCSETQRRERHGLELLIRFLREQGVCPAGKTHPIAADDVSEEFAQSLRRDQGLAVVTVETYARLTRKFLVWRFAQGEICLHDVRATDASAFIQSEAKRMGPAALKNVVTALRSFFHYAQFRGEVTVDLPQACQRWPVGRAHPQSPEPSLPNTHSARLIVATGGPGWADVIAPCCCFWRDWGYEPARSSG